MTNLKTIMALFSVSVFSPFCFSSDANFPELTQQQLLENSASGKPQVILDVRTAKEFAEGHVPQAANISHNELSTKITEIIKLSRDRTIPVVVYCRSGHRAGIALEILKTNGFTNLYHLEGDMNGWVKAKKAIEK